MKLVFQNQWDDPCLIASDPMGMAMLEQLARDLAWHSSDESGRVLRLLWVESGLHRHQCPAMTFEVTFEPELPDHGAVFPPKKVSWTAAYGAADGQPDHDLRYVICGKVVCYYPASLATLLGDLLGEQEALESGSAHNVSMSGYTLLLAEITGDNVAFRYPWPNGELVGKVPIADVRDALETASARLWAYLKALSAATD